MSVASSADAPAALDGRNLVVAAGAAGAVLLPKKAPRRREVADRWRST